MLDTEVMEEAGIRLAKAADEDALVWAIRQMGQDNEWGIRHADGRSLTFSEARTRATVRKAVIPNWNNPDEQAWIGIYGPPGEVWGSVYLQEGAPFCSDDRLLYELWNYVLPAHRENANAGRQLIQFATQLAGVLQLPLVIGVMSHIRTAAKMRLYRRVLGPQSKQMGALFLYHASNDDGTEFEVQEA